MDEATPEPPPLLLIEDEAVLGLALADELEAQGFVVSLCGTGFDALNFIEMEREIAAIVVDIGLGAGPDGWEVAQRAREHFPDAPVVYISAGSGADYPEHGVPGSAFLRKPFPPAELVGTVTALMN